MEYVHGIIICGNVSTVKMGTISVLGMTYFLIQSRKAINVFLRYKIFYHVLTNIEEKQRFFSPLNLLEMTKERKR